MKAEVRQHGDIRASEELRVDEVAQHRGVHAAELAGQTHAVKLETADRLEQLVELGGGHGFAILEACAEVVDRLGARSDLNGDELADHLSHATVKLDRVSRVGEAAFERESALRCRCDRRPVDAAFEIEF